MTPSKRAVRTVLALIPVVMLSLAIPFVNRVDPRILGMPFLMAWIVFWVLVTPAFLLTIYRLEGRTWRTPR
jgi:hypothetical protein